MSTVSKGLKICARSQPCAEAPLSVNFIAKSYDDYRPCISFCGMWGGSMFYIHLTSFLPVFDTFDRPIVLVMKSELDRAGSPRNNISLR